MSTPPCTTSSADARSGRPSHRPPHQSSRRVRTSGWATRPPCRPPSRNACGGPDRDARGAWIIPLLQAVVHNALRLSNAAYVGINEATPTSALEGRRRGPGPPARSGYAGAERIKAAGQGVGRGEAGRMSTPHDEPDGVSAQQYPPDDLQAVMQELIALPPDRSRFRGEAAGALGPAALERLGRG